MKFSFNFLAFLVIFSVCVFTNANAEPENLATVKKELISYHDSGDYSLDLSRTMNQALYYLRFRINQNNRLVHPKKLAIVLDIDETSLSNYPDLKRLSFGGTPEEVDSAEGAGHDHPIRQTLELYNYAKKNHVAVFFITGRHPTIRNNTVLNLTAAGFKNFDGLYLKPNDYHQKSVVPYKSEIRREITAKGYDIVLNIGDQESDLKGGYSDMAFKLPNPFYLIR